MTPIRTSRDVNPSADTPGVSLMPYFSGGERFSGTLEPQFVAGGDASVALPVDDDGCFAVRSGRRYKLSNHIPSSYYGEGAEAAGIDTRAVNI